MFINCDELNVKSSRIRNYRSQCYHRVINAYKIIIKICQPKTAQEYRCTYYYTWYNPILYNKQFLYRSIMYYFTLGILIFCVPFVYCIL